MATSNSGEGSQSMATSNSGEGSQSMATSNSGEGSQSMATSSSDLQKYLVKRNYAGLLQMYYAGKPDNQLDNNQELRPSTPKEDNPIRSSTTSTRFVVITFGNRPPSILSVQVDEPEPEEDLSQSLFDWAYFGNGAHLDKSLEQMNTSQESGPSSDDNPVINTREFVRCLSCLSMAKASSYLIGLLGNREPEIQICAESVEDVFHLMTDEYGHLIFMKLVECHDSAVVNYMLHCKNELLISASLYKYGSLSVIKLIEVFKDTKCFIELTHALSNGIYTLLTHEFGNQVVITCLTLLESDTNEAFYASLMNVCVSVGVHEQGCLSLCKCIDALKNARRRADLLNVVVKGSVQMSSIPSGIHVLNYIMGEEHNTDLASEICSKLKSHTERLSTTRKGSEFLQTCLRSVGIRHVIEGLMATKCTSSIARDIFGLHVMQTALELTRNDVYKKLHSSLLQALLPYMEVFKFHPGKVLYNMIKSEVPLDKKLSHKGKR